MSLAPPAARPMVPLPGADGDDGVAEGVEGAAILCGAETAGAAGVGIVVGGIGADGADGAVSPAAGILQSSVFAGLPPEGAQLELSTRNSTVAIVRMKWIIRLFFSSFIAMTSLLSLCLYIR